MAPLNNPWVQCSFYYYSHPPNVFQEILENSLSQEFTVENVLATLPAFPKGAPQQRAKRAAEALVKAQNYSRQMAMQQVRKWGSLFQFISV